MNQFHPMKLLQLRNAWEQFKQRHPKLPFFMDAATRGAISEGSVIEITVTTPQGKSISSNIKVTKEDMQLMEEMKRLMESQG